MNIREWPLDKRLALPQWCFGQRWPIAVAEFMADENYVFDISEGGLPEHAVIWQLVLATFSVFNVTHVVSLYLGDRLPTTLAELTANEPLFREFRLPGYPPSSVEISGSAAPIQLNMRHYVAAGGRRLIGGMVRHDGVATGGSAFVVVSSLPTEVPDWLISR